MLANWVGFWDFPHVAGVSWFECWRGTGIFGWVKFDGGGFGAGGFRGGRLWRWWRWVWWGSGLVSTVGTCFATRADGFGVVFAYLAVISFVLIRVTYLFIATSCLALPPRATFSTALVLPLALFNSPPAQQPACFSLSCHAIISYFPIVILPAVPSTAISPTLSIPFTVT